MNGRWVPVPTFWKNLLPPSVGSTLQIEVVGASIMWVLLYQMTGYHIPEDSYLHGQGLENLKFHLCSYQFCLSYDAYILLWSWLKHFLMKNSLLLLFFVSTNELNLLLYHNEHPETHLNKYHTQLFHDGFCIFGVY